ncbi:MAG: TlpA family protein disulfide reductase [Nitrospirae bacterium]|nr:TlpA family protein disulfide reductase [Nitrospirota bacterium]
MKYRGLILIFLLVVGVSLLLFLPNERTYKEIAAVGKPAPDFELKDTNGNVWKLSDLKGKVVFVNFWATWCPTCKAEMPYKESLYEKMQGKPFQMLGILFRDDPRNLIPYFQRQKVSAPTLVDDVNEVARAYGITGAPETFIIDKDGIVRGKFIGSREWDSPQSIALIEKWL